MYVTCCIVAGLPLTLFQDAALVMYGDGLCLYTYPIVSYPCTQLILDLMATPQTPQGDLAIHIFHYDGGPQPGVDDDSVVDLGPIISSRTKWQEFCSDAASSMTELPLWTGYQSLQR